jgi:hypothetical protein
MQSFVFLYRMFWCFYIYVCSIFDISMYIRMFDVDVDAMNTLIYLVSCMVGVLCDTDARLASSRFSGRTD